MLSVLSALHDADDVPVLDPDSPADALASAGFGALLISTASDAFLEAVAKFTAAVEEDPETCDILDQGMHLKSRLGGVLLAARQCARILNAQELFLDLAADVLCEPL